MNITDFDTLDASLTLRNLSREEKQAVVRLMELSIEETAKEYTAKYAAQHKMHPTAAGGGYGVSFLVGIIVGLLVAHLGGG